MRTGKFYCASHDLPNNFFGWMACVFRTHKWETADHWRFINEARLICRRCSQSQWLHDVPDDWDGHFVSRHFDPVIAALTALMFLVPAVLVISLILQ